jgi:hypothetical protein
MGFIVIEEWGDKDNPYRYHWVQVSATTFATREEADEEAKKHQPQHVDGYIRVRKEPQEKPTPKRKGGKKLARLREGRRRNKR